MKNKILALLLRHSVTAVAGAFIALAVSKGLVDQDQAVSLVSRITDAIVANLDQFLAGSGLLLGSVGASVLDKKKK